MNSERFISVEVTELSKNMGSNQALSNLSMKFGSGLIHGIIGPEGAGKTTLMRVMVGLLKPDKGRLIYSDSGEASDFKLIRDNIAYMPQTQSLYPDLSIGEHLDFFRELYALDKNEYQKKKEELLEITRLGKFLSRPAGQLSGGMYKKLGLMCALLRSPRALFLDEPTNGVDPISRREFWDLLYKLLSLNILVVISTSYMDEAERCSKVHLLDRGKLLAEGEPREIMKRENVKNFNELFVRQAQ